MCPHLCMRSSFLPLSVSFHACLSELIFTLASSLFKFLPLIFPPPLHSSFPPCLLISTDLNPTLLSLSLCVALLLSFSVPNPVSLYTLCLCVFGSLAGQQCQTRRLEDRRHSCRTTGGLLVVSLRILVAAERKKEGLAMVTAMEDACPNGVREEKEEVTPPGPPGVEGPPAVQSTQEADASGAMQQVLDNLGDLPTSTGAKDIDLLFLRGIMESPIAHEQLEEVKLEAVQDNNVELVTDILGDISNLKVKDDSAAELSRILQEPHFQSLLEAHDMVASKCYEVPPPTETVNDAAVNSALMQADAVRMIGIRKKAGEPLGVTFRVEKDDLVIARILHGGMIDRQGLLHVGDIIKEVNGKDVGNNPTELQEMLKDCSGGITLKILPSYRDAPAPPQVYVRPYFDYNPTNDNLIPCREAGMAFAKGDILQIVNREDPNWWQACHVVGGATGLIPSQFLEEKRKAFVPRDFDGSGILCGTIAGKKKKKMMYLTAKNAEFDRHELQIYEEVAKVPPFQRKTLVLIGAQGVGRRSLKNRLMVLQPTRFGTTIPYTSRRPRDDELDGNSYHFTTRTEMEVDVKAGRFLEHGEYDGNLYGTKIESIHEVVGTGRTCILDVNPQALKVLKTAEFMPYVVFIAAPDFDTLKAMHKAVVDAGITTKQLTDVDLRKTVDESARIQRAYSHYFDLTIVNDNLDKAFETLQAAVDKLCSEPQWVPVNWVY